VVESLRAKVPAGALYVAIGIDVDERVSEAVALAGNARISLLEVTRTELDRLSDRGHHQGMALQVPPFEHSHPADLLEAALAAPAPLLVALDGVTDPRNLGAVVRSAAAFGAQGVLVPERRSASMTAAAWRTSAGAAARLPVAQCTNLARTLREYREAGLFVVGLAADGAVTLDELELATEPLVLVVGSEGSGLGRLVAETCDLTVSIPMAGGTESLNAGIAGAVALAEVASPAPDGVAAPAADGGRRPHGDRAVRRPDVTAEARPRDELVTRHDRTPENGRERPGLPGSSVRHSHLQPSFL
jgi:23S rRNA (guanosine2251-2'-O)-methyltransferase